MSLFSLITGSFDNEQKLDSIFVETQPYEKGFAKHYEKYLKPHIISFEEKRIKALNKARKRIIISIPLLILALIIGFLILHINQYNDILFRVSPYFFIGLFSLATWWIYKSINKYTESIKTDIFPNIISFLGEYKYSHYCNNKIYKLKDSDIIPSYDRETNEDEIIGEYKGVKINLFESKLETRRHSKDGTYYSTAFKGIVITLSMHKKFKGKTILRQDKGSIFNWLNKKMEKLDNVKLEDPNFEKIFEVYSSDQIEARYLLTTAFIQRLINLSESFQGKALECSFFNNKLLIMIPVEKNLFEPGSIYEPEDFIDDSKSLLKEMNIIFQIIDILKLDQNIGM